MEDEVGGIAHEADFSIIRYAQCWEDADTVLEALAPRPGDVHLSVASAGDNTLSILATDPACVHAVDLSVAQLACLEIRTAAYRRLTHDELLELVGARPSTRRLALYDRLSGELSETTRNIWDARTRSIQHGIGSAGKFERYLEILRLLAIDLTHSRRQRLSLFSPKSSEERRRFFEREWNNWRWRVLLKALCSRPVLGRLGRDRRFFRYAEADVGDRILAKVHHALVELDPSQNPYAHWIAFGTYGSALPHALREENFRRIGGNLERLQLHHMDIKDFLKATPAHSIDGFNLSDVLEYVSPEESEQLYALVARAGKPGSRIAHWNMLVPRYRPESFADRIRPLADFSKTLRTRSKTFFYDDFVVEEIL